MSVTQAANVATLIRAVEQADSPARLAQAVWALAEARTEAGIPALIAALGYNNPEAAVIAVQGLIQMGDVAVPVLLERIDDYNYGARAYSFRVLASIAHPQALDVLLSAAETDFAPSVRCAAAKGLGNLRWSKLPAEQRHAAQDRALKTLLLLSQDPEWAIRYASVVGLQALAISSQSEEDGPTYLLAVIHDHFSQLVTAESDLAVQARVWMAQQQMETAIKGS